jgi:hypothetical protein
MGIWVVFAPMAVRTVSCCGKEQSLIQYYCAHRLRRRIHHIADGKPQSSTVVTTAVYSRSSEIRKFGLDSEA